MIFPTVLPQSISLNCNLLLYLLHNNQITLTVQLRNLQSFIGDNFNKIRQSCNFFLCLSTFHGEKLTIRCR